MALPDFTNILLTAKKKKGLSFSQLGSLLDRDEVWVASLFYGQASASSDEAEKLLATLELDQELVDALTTSPL